ncbi:hypothetical protein AQUCO_00800196v1 [Aquilegia coerulea]|uniref:Uncharacterized protein n=1 Tax=Aquilegia coerulea TaxID=218851 RepID=A0A2G5EHU0_AQUCA|nr:hypothetical protein AQUCO_00800196v1 [Aquilegia coerulea]
MAVVLLEEFGLPLGILFVVNISEVGSVRATGYMWIVQENKVEHNFKMISKLVSYDTEIHDYVEKYQIKNSCCGLQLMSIIDDPPIGKIHFKSDTNY